MKKIVLILFILSIFVHAFAQTSPKKQKFYTLFKSAVFDLYAGDTVSTIEKCNKLITKDPNYTEPYILKAQVFYYQKKYNQAINLLDIVLDIDSIYSDVYYLKALYLFDSQCYTDAIPFFEKYISLESDTNAINNAIKKIELSNFRINSINNPVPFKPIKFNNFVNSNQSEYFPTISADNNALIFTRLTNSLEDIFICRKINNQWKTSVGVSPYVNTPLNNEGAHTLSADGMTMIFTRCILNEGCDLYITHKDASGFWLPPERLPYPVNSRYWDSQPCLSPDGKTLYFTSTRPGGKGKMDIWAVDKFDDAWGIPYNLGDSINTAEQEMSPFIHFDNKHLYFSSTGYLGMGNFDLYMSTKLNDTTWSSPKNLGYPINTNMNEFRLVIDATGRKGYFSTSKDTVNKQDIYYFDLYDKIKPERTVYVKAEIFTLPAYQSTEADLISMIDLENNDTVFIDKNLSYFLICLPENGEYALNVAKEGYLFYSENFNLKNIPDSLNFYELEIYLTPILVNTKIILKNIFFDTDSYIINPKSYVELNKLVDFLNFNPELEIQINGHTDSIGEYNYNIILSQNRAKSIVEYLVLKGISFSRLHYKGYGYTMPIADNQSPDGRKQNRRTEIVILKK